MAAPLATLGPTISAAGITAPQYSEIVNSLIASAQAIFGADIYLAEDSQDGQLLAVFALAQHASNDGVIAAYNSFSPATAVGAGLSSVVKINGLRRQTSSRSTAVLTIVGQAFIPIVSGIVVDDNQNQWALPPLVTIPFGGEISVTATCQVPGAIAAPANTITNILNLQPGWQSATNPDPAVPGAPVETDAALRQRQAISTGAPAETPREAIAAAVANVPGVVRSVVFQNDGDVPDANGIPGHSVAAVVAGGDVNAIASAIAIKKSEGCGTFGTVSVVVFDSHGVPDTINFFELETVEIYVALSIQPLLGYLSSTGGLIQGAIAAAINGLGIGQSLYADYLNGPAKLSGDAATSSSGLSQSALDGLAATYVIRSLTWGLSSSVLGTTDVNIAFYSAADCDSLSNITITLLT